MEISSTEKERIITIAKEISVDYLLGTNKLEPSSDRQRLEKDIIVAISNDDNTTTQTLTENNQDAQIILKSTISMINAMINVMLAEISTNENITDPSSMLDAEIKKFLMMFMTKDKFINNLSQALELNN
ncbi:MAG: hypothetical protein IJW59_05165 [Clostridia bacterium]|nr:hypothetical protein [Clostridia bacterium]